MVFVGYDKDTEVYRYFDPTMQIAFKRKWNWVKRQPWKGMFSNELIISSVGVGLESPT